MLCYKDITYCEYHKKCKKGAKCYRALTQNVKKGAERTGMLIAIFAEKPECFEEFLED